MAVAFTVYGLAEGFGGLSVLAGLAGAVFFTAVTCGLVYVPALLVAGAIHWLMRWRDVEFPTRLWRLTLGRRDKYDTRLFGFCTGAFLVLPQDRGRIPGDPQ
jgi:hypothetical protein